VPGLCAARVLVSTKIESDARPRPEPKRRKILNLGLVFRQIRRKTSPRLCSWALSADSQFCARQKCAHFRVTFLGPFQHRILLLNCICKIHRRHIFLRKWVGDSQRKTHTHTAQDSPLSFTGN